MNLVDFLMFINKNPLTNLDISLYKEFNVKFQEEISEDMLIGFANEGLFANNYHGDFFNKADDLKYLLEINEMEQFILPNFTVFLTDIMIEKINQIGSLVYYISKYKYFTLFKEDIINIFNKNWITFENININGQRIFGTDFENVIKSKIIDIAHDLNETDLHKLYSIIADSFCSEFQYSALEKEELMKSYNMK